VLSSRKLLLFIVLLAYAIIGAASVSTCLCNSSPLSFV
jgi:hypothetical protein